VTKRNSDSQKIIPQFDLDIKTLASLRNYVQSGDKPMAMKLLIDTVHCGLAEAKQYVDQLARPPSSSATQIMQLKVTIDGSSPPIWRRLEIAADATFLDLHGTIQDAMGWDGGHLHGFTVERKTTKRPILIGSPSRDSYFKTKSERTERIVDWLGTKCKQLLYTYDYGDNWDHTVLLEKILPAEQSVDYPRCIAGKRACPPEDCGGIWGYQDMLEILADPTHPDYKDTREWFGLEDDDEPFDPDHFDPNEIVFRPSDMHDLYAMFGADESDEDEDDEDGEWSPGEPYIAPATPGRNDTCSCGSGKKYKKCCGSVT
jgi:hypothetical protein